MTIGPTRAIGLGLSGRVTRLEPVGLRRVRVSVGDACLLHGGAVVRVAPRGMSYVHDEPVARCNRRARSAAGGDIARLRCRNMAGGVTP